MMELGNGRSRRNRERGALLIDETQRKAHQLELKKNKLDELQERLKQGVLGRDSRTEYFITSHYPQD